MKKLIIFSAIIAIFTIGCKTQQKATGYTYDDVYSNRADHSKITPKPVMQNEDLSAAQPVSSTDSSSTLAAKAAASNQDYSNDSYAARIKRFHGNNSGLGYNSDYYTGSSDSTSSSGGSSPDYNFYFGNSWGSSFWGPSFSFGLGYGWGNCGCYDPYSWYYPYSWCYPYSWGYPYYSFYPYSYGYWDYPYGGHHNNWWDWNNGFSRGSFYGRRSPLNNPDGGRNSRTGTNGINPVPGQGKNTRTVDTKVVKPAPDQTRSGRADINRVPPDKARYRYSRTNSNGTARDVRKQTNTNNKTGRNYVQGRQPAPRYIRPGVQQQTARSETQIYSSPAYRQPKSSQEYITPRTQQGHPSATNGNVYRNGNNNYPSPSGRRYSPPGNTSGNSRIFSNPSGGYRSSGMPSRSYSSPGSSSPSRSSSPSFSAPSRSGSEGGSGRSSGGGDGGGRRR